MNVKNYVHHDGAASANGRGFKTPLDSAQSRITFPLLISLGRYCDLNRRPGVLLYRFVTGGKISKSNIKSWF